MYNDYNRRERVAALALSAFCAATRERRVALRPGGGADAPGAPHAHVRARVESDALHHALQLDFPE